MNIFTRLYRWISNRVPASEVAVPGNVNEIDKLVSTISQYARVAKVVHVASSPIAENYRDTYFTNPENGKMAKVEFLMPDPDVRISYYFFNDHFIKSEAIDNSTSQTLIINSYFCNGKIIHASHQYEGGGNNGTFLLKNAADYLAKFKAFRIENKKFSF